MLHSFYFFFFSFVIILFILFRVLLCKIMAFKLNTTEICFEKVYDNGFHSLQQFEISNLTNQKLQVQLDSDTLKEQVIFQLYNENINDVATAIATNTANTPQDFSRFNQVFNYVNCINSIYLKPQQTLSFVIAFLPYPKKQPQQQNAFVYDNISGIIRFTALDYTLNVDFHATLCQSVLAVDELETGLIFEDSIVGETYIKDITIRNLSAIDLHWRLNTLDLNQPQQRHVSIPDNECLQFVDASTFLTLDSFKVIAPFSAYTFRVIFIPKEAGKFDYDLQIENVNDVQNIIQIKIHATTQRFIHKETLVVSSGNMLDFGDCIAGSWSMQQIVLNNISESPIEVHFGIEGEAELTFNVQTCLEDQEIELSTTATMTVTDTTTTLSANTNGIERSDSLLVTWPVSPSVSQETLFSQEEYTSIASSYTSSGIYIMQYNIYI